MNFSISILFLFYCFSSFSQERAEKTISYSEIQEKLKELQQLTFKQYPQKMNQVRTQYQKYVRKIRMECKSKVSSLVIENDEFVLSQKERKFSRKERKLCLQKLRRLQIDFINGMFYAREKYLKALHKKELEDLSKAKEVALEKLSSRNSRKRSRRKN